MKSFYESGILMPKENSQKKTFKNKQRKYYDYRIKISLWDTACEFLFRKLTDKGAAHATLLEL